MRLKKGDLNDQLMALAAFRYCLGRQSYIVSACPQWLRDTWGQFDRNTRQVVVCDIIEALMDELLSDPGAEKIGWESFGKYGYDALPREDQDWIRESVEYKKNPGPGS